MSIYFLVPWFGIFAAKVMIIPNTFLLNSCRIRKKIAIFVKKKMLTKMVALLCILLFIMAITGIICLIGKINGWHSPIADKM